jgi:hypothetical protein
MKNAVAVLLLIFAVSCTKKSPSGVEQTPTPAAPVEEKADLGPALEIDPADRVCSEDSDCEVIGTHCSCSCGEGVNKTQSHKYSGKLDELCKGYSGKMCKMLCNGVIRCQREVCTYVYL